MLMVRCGIVSALVHAALALVLLRQPLVPVAPPRDHFETMEVRIVLEAVTVEPEAAPEDRELPTESPLELVRAAESASSTVVAGIEPEDARTEERSVDPGPVPVSMETSVPEPGRPGASVVALLSDAEVHAYWSDVSGRIARHLVYPRDAQARRSSGRVVMVLRVDTAGALSGRIADGDVANAVLVSAVDRAIRKAGPVSPPPAGMGAPAEAILPIRFDMP